MRRAEAIQVWGELSGIEPVFWDLPCRSIPLTDKVAVKITEAIYKYRPDCLFVPFFLEDPNDHRKTNHLLWLASQSSTLPDIEVWAYQITTMICPNVAVDITDVIERKYQLMKMWVSQNSIFDYAHQSRGLNAANALYHKGKRDGRPPQPYVELFFVVPMAEYLDLLESYYGQAEHVNIYGE